MSSQSLSASNGSARPSDADSSCTSISTGQQINSAPIWKHCATIRDTPLSPLFDENVLAKIFKTASSGLLKKTPLEAYPHTVPQTGQDAGIYEYREADFWTCGFFPGSIYCLLERAVKYPQALTVPDDLRSAMPEALSRLGQHWTIAIHEMSDRTDTHDMGFIVQPALQQQWELTGDSKALDSVKRAAYALASRFDERLGVIRSWDIAVNDRYSFTDKNENFLVIVDSLCNLDLLYYISHHFCDPYLAHVATSHAQNVMKSIIRSDGSTFHLINFDPASGEAKAKMTNQGFCDSSTWSRGQAWAIMGLAQTYGWTKDISFLQGAIKCADLFLQRLAEAEQAGRDDPYVPAWDFDAPLLTVTEETRTDPVLRDTSAGLIAANGLLLIHQHLQTLPAPAALKQNPASYYLDAAIRIVSETINLSLDTNFARFSLRLPFDLDALDKWQVSGGEKFEAIVRNATANNNEHAHMPYRDHGLVYGDYYFLEFGNKLLRMGLC